MKFKAIGAISTLMLCLAGVHLSNVYMPDNMRFFVGYFCGVAVMFLIAILRDKESRARVAGSVAVNPETSTEQAQPPATYRTQAIVGDGNVQAGGDIEGSGGRSEMRVDEQGLTKRS